MEFARAVEEIFGGPRPEMPAATPPPALNGKPPTHDTVVDERRKPPPPIPVARPVTGSGGPGTFRERLTDLTGGLAFVPLVCLACTAPWALIGGSTPWAVLAQVFLLSTTLTWSLLLVARVSRRPDKNPWARRSLHLMVGTGRRPPGVLARRLGHAARDRERDVTRSRPRHRPSPEPRGARYRSPVSLLLWTRGGGVPVVDRGRPETEGARPPLANRGGGVLVRRVPVPVAMGIDAGDRRDCASGNRRGGAPGHESVDACSGPTTGSVALATPSASGVCLVVVNEDARGV